MLQLYFKIQHLKYKEKDKFYLKVQKWFFLIKFLMNALANQTLNIFYLNIFFVRHETLQKTHDSNFHSVFHYWLIKMSPILSSYLFIFSNNLEKKSILNFRSLKTTFRYPVLSGRVFKQIIIWFRLSTKQMVHYTLKNIYFLI